ncbi:hypothetical protein GCM10010360_11310 [Streptomyces nogalater]
MPADAWRHRADRAREPERVLRRRGGNPRHCARGPGEGAAVHGSAGQEVGAWRVEGA